MLSAFFSDIGNLAFLVLFALLGVAMRNMARHQPEEDSPSALDPQLEAASLVPAARVERVLSGPRAGKLERRMTSRPVGCERRASVREALAAEAEAAEQAPESEAVEEGFEENFAETGVIARLVPQIPIRRDEKPRSWFGGSPEMPASTPWPKFSGRRALFLAQICCSDLPDGLWHGRGPRKGWLGFFIDPSNDHEMRVLHFADRTTRRPAPPPGASCVWRQPHGDGPRRVDAFPHWPLDIVAVAPGDADPRIAEGLEEARQGLFAQGFDLASPEHHPFDWPSAKALVEMALAATARRRALIKTAWPGVEKQLASARKQIELGGMTKAMQDEMEQRAADLPRLIDAWKESVASLEAATERLKAIADELHMSSEEGDFTPETAALLMNRLAAIEIVHVERIREPERGENAETVQVTRMPLTRHDPAAPLFAQDYEPLREDWAKHAYCAGEGEFTPEQLAYLENRWRNLAAREMSGLGHLPFHLVPGFNPDSQMLLIELVSSELLKWRFGENGALSATLDDSALAQSDFARLRSQISV